MQRNTWMVVLGLTALGFSACGDSSGPRLDAAFLAGSDGADPKVAMCSSLETSAREEYNAYLTSLKRTATLSCQVDSECALVTSPSINCVASCGQMLWTVDVPAFTAATAKLCDKYFAAGCPQKTPPCPGGYPICEQGGCNLGARSISTDGGGDGAAVDASLVASVVDASVSSDAPTCDQLAATAQAQATSYIEASYALSCQVDADCAFLQARPLSCFSVCGNFVVRSADVSVLTSATANFCDAYFGAGCPERVPPCPFSRPVCDRGTCARGGPGYPDAAVDAGTAIDSARG